MKFPSILSKRRRSLVLTIMALVVSATLLVIQLTAPSESSKETRAASSSEMTTKAAESEEPPPNPFLLTPEQTAEVKRVQAERIALMIRECRKEPQPDGLTFEKTMAQIARRSEVVDKYRIANCMVLKAGFTAWNALLAHVLDRQDLIKSHQTYLMSKLLKATTTRYMQVNQDPNFIKFVVTRNPLSRLLSAFRDRIDAEYNTGAATKFIPLILTHSRGKGYNPVHENGTKVVPTFGEFIEYITSVPADSHDPHWRPVSLQCGLCYVNYTFIAHAETLNADLGYILRETGMEKDTDYTILLYNSHKGKGNTRDLMEPYYRGVSSQLMQKILDVYRRDFTIFGYDPTAFVKRLYPDGSVVWRP